MTSIRSGSAIPGVFLLVFAIICGITPANADQSQSFVFLADSQGGATIRQASVYLSYGVQIGENQYVVAQNVSAGLRMSF
jgi:hypothetical protein